MYCENFQFAQQTLTQMAQQTLTQMAQTDWKNCKHCYGKDGVCGLCFITKTMRTINKGKTEALPVLRNNLRKRTNKRKASKSKNKIKPASVKEIKVKLPVKPSMDKFLTPVKEIKVKLPIKPETKSTKNKCIKCGMLYYVYHFCK